MTQPLSSQPVPVWDLFVRIFHWSLVVCVFLNFLVEEGEAPHQWIGYAASALVAARIGASWVLPMLRASGASWGLLAVTTTSFKTCVFSALAGCQKADDEKATAMAAARGRMRYPMKLSQNYRYLSGL